MEFRNCLQFLYTERSALCPQIVATMTDDIYADCCGFTEQEVKDMLKCQNIDDIKK